MIAKTVENTDPKERPTYKSARRAILEDILMTAKTRDIKVTEVVIIEGPGGAVLSISAEDGENYTVPVDLVGKSIVVEVVPPKDYAESSAKTGRVEFP